MSIIVNTNGKAYLDTNGKVLEGIKPDIEISSLSITANGTYTAPEGTAYTPVTVAIPTYDGSVT